MAKFDRITFDPNIMGGQACIRGMRIPVSLVLNLLSNGTTDEEILKEYPDIEKEDIKQALGYAAKELGLEQRLSSDNLYHFTKCISTIKVILKEGLRYKLDEERIPYKNTFQRPFRICFCDIRVKQTSVHRSKYGNNAIGLTKDWGIKNGISPITYIHKGSLPASVEYQEFKNRYNALIEFCEKDLDLNIAHRILFWSLGIDAGLLKAKESEESFKPDSDIIDDRIHELDGNFSRFMNYLNGSVICRAFFDEYLLSLGIRIHEIYAHLHYRDLMTRIYEEYMNGIRKINYDEREWRAIELPNSPQLLEALKDQKRFNKPIQKEEANAIIEAEKTYWEDAYKQAYLPVQRNLKFSDDDIVAILVENEKSAEEMKEFVRTEQTLLHYEAVKDKIYSIDEFAENQD